MLVHSISLSRVQDEDFGEPLIAIDFCGRQAPVEEAQTRISDKNKKIKFYRPTIQYSVLVSELELGRQGKDKVTKWPSNGNKRDTARLPDFNGVFGHVFFTGMV
jgi:hypothetical protein